MLRSLSELTLGRLTCTQSFLRVWKLWTFKCSRPCAPFSGSFVCFLPRLWEAGGAHQSLYPLLYLFVTSTGHSRYFSANYHSLINNSQPNTEAVGGWRHLLGQKLRACARTFTDVTWFFFFFFLRRGQEACCCRCHCRGPGETLSSNSPRSASLTTWAQFMTLWSILVHKSVTGTSHLTFDEDFIKQ